MRVLRSLRKFLLTKRVLCDIIVVLLKGAYDKVEDGGPDPAPKLNNELVGIAGLLTGSDMPFCRKDPLREQKNNFLWQ